jgi:hypothetical protein
LSGIGISERIVDYLNDGNFQHLPILCYSLHTHAWSGKPQWHLNATGTITCNIFLRIVHNYFYRNIESFAIEQCSDVDVCTENRARDRDEIVARHLLVLSFDGKIVQVAVTAEQRLFLNAAKRRGRLVPALRDPVDLDETGS